MGDTNLHPRQSHCSGPLHGNKFFYRYGDKLCFSKGDWCWLKATIVVGWDIPCASGSAVLQRQFQKLGSHDHNSSWLVSLILVCFYCAQFCLWVLKNASKTRKRIDGCYIYFIYVSGFSIMHPKHRKKLCFMFLGFQSLLCAFNTSNSLQITFFWICEVGLCRTKIGCH